MARPRAPEHSKRIAAEGADRRVTGPKWSIRTVTTVSIMMRPLIYLGFYLALAALAARGLNTYFSEDHELRWVAVGLLLAFFVLAVSFPWLMRRLWWYPHLYMTLQGGLALSLLLFPPHPTSTSGQSCTSCSALRPCCCSLDGPVYCGSGSSQWRWPVHCSMRMVGVTHCL